MGFCSRSVLITFTVRVTKQHHVNISFLKKLVQSIIKAQSVLPSKNRNKSFLIYMLYINHLVSFCYLIIAIFFPGNCATCIEGTHTFRSVVQLYITCIYYVWSLRLVKEERPAKMLYDTLISTCPICDVLYY